MSVRDTQVAGLVHRWQVGKLFGDEKHNLYSRVLGIGDSSSMTWEFGNSEQVIWHLQDWVSLPIQLEKMSSYTIEMLKGLNGAIYEKNLSRYLANNKYLIKMLMMRVTGINLW